MKRSTTGPALKRANIAPALKRANIAPALKNPIGTLSTPPILFATSTAEPVVESYISIDTILIVIGVIISIIAAFLLFRYMKRRNNSKSKKGGTIKLPPIGEY